MAETKINFLNGSLFSRFASNPTDASRFLTNNIVEVVTDYMLADPESGFTGVVLSGIATGQNQGSSNYPADAEQVSRSFTFNGVTSTTIHLGVYVRPVNRQSSATTDPIRATNQKEKSWLIGMQDFAISDKPIDQVGAIPAGSKVMCYYATAPEMGFPEKTLFFKTSELVSNSYLSYISQGFTMAGSMMAGMFNGVQDPTLMAQYQSTYLNIPAKWNGALPTIPEAVITSPFGPRRPPTTSGGQGSSDHGGIDIAGGAPNGGRGTPIYAVNDGKVSAINSNSETAGKMIFIKHSGGWQTEYMHLDSILVGYGDVARGQVIGTMGNTGNSSGTHLHFTVRKDGKKVDPLLVFGWNYTFSNKNTEARYKQRLAAAGAGSSQPAPSNNPLYPPESEQE